MPNFRCRRSSRTTQSMSEPKLRSRFRCRNDSATMKPRVEPDALEDDVVRDEVADEVLLALESW